MRNLTHKLTGIDAATAMLLEEVQEIFHSKTHKLKAKDDWRLEFYIMQVMCADMNASYEVLRDKIEKMVNLCNNYHRPKSEWNTAFRRLVRGGFMYSKMHTENQFERHSTRSRYYALEQGKYDTAKVMA